MAMSAFYRRCLETARRETRNITTFGDPRLPDGQYIFTELYCDDPNCECRRVMLLVQPVGRLDVALATLTYGWESAEYYGEWVRDVEIGKQMAVLALEILAEQSPYAEAFLEFAQKNLIEDPVYMERLKRHYAEFRATLPSGEKPRHMGPRGPAFTPPRKKKKRK